MKECWYQGNTGIGPLDNAIKKAIKLGYNHHIERLMIIANLMDLARIDPKEVYKWFMEYYVTHLIDLWPQMFMVWDFIVMEEFSLLNHIYVVQVIF